jgi:hypothetical protein
MRPGGVRAVVAESLFIKHQLLISSRARLRAPNLNSFDRFVLDLGSLIVPASQIPKLAVILKSSFVPNLAIPSQDRVGQCGSGVSWAPCGSAFHGGYSVDGLS